MFEKIQMRKINFAFFEEKKKNISKSLDRRLKIRPEINSSRKNKSVIFLFSEIVCLSRKIEQKQGQN